MQTNNVTPYHNECYGHHTHALPYGQVPRTKNFLEKFLTSRSDGPKGGRHGWQATKNFLEKFLHRASCPVRYAPTFGR